MGQLFNRLRDFARSHIATSGADIADAERMINSEDEELRRIIDELHRDYTENPNSHTQNNRHSQRHQDSTVSLPPDVIDAHRCLNVALGSEPEEIKRAYRGLIATWHPDRFASASANEQQHAHTRAHEINAAYMVLRDHYDFR